MISFKKKYVSNRRGIQQGFTLLELLVAVAILALIAVIAWRGLDEIIRTRESLEIQQNRVDTLQRIFTRIEQDASQAAKVSVGNRRLLLSRDPQGQRVFEYVLNHDELSRRITGFENNENLPLISGVTDFTVEKWMSGKGWTKDNDSEMFNFGETNTGFNAMSQGDVAAPRMLSTQEVTNGVRVTLKFQNGESFQHCFLVGAG